MNVGQRLTITHVDGDPATLVVVGEIDAFSSPALEGVLERAEGSELRIEMSAVTFMDSTGLRALVRAHHDSRRDGRELTVVAPSPAVMRLMELTSLDERLKIEVPPG